MAATDATKFLNKTEYEVALNRISSLAKSAELVLSEGIASNSSRIASLEDWMKNPSLDELEVGEINALSFNVGGNELVSSMKEAELILSEGMSSLSGRISSLEDWLLNPALDELQVGELGVNGRFALNGDAEVNGNVKASSFIKSGGTSSQFLKADGSVDSNSYLKTTGGTVSGNITTSGYVAVGTGRNNGSYIASDTTANIYLHNSAGVPLVADGLVVRRGAEAPTATLGSTTYPWGGVYSTSFVKDGGTASQFLKADGSVDATPYWDMKAAYHFANGYLVETSLVSTANQQIFFIIEGRQHGGKPFFVQGNAWYQSSGAVFASGHSFATRYGAPMGNITLFVYNGHICMWFTQPTSYCFFRVAITIGTNNRVTSITNSAIPSSASSKVTITPGAALADTYLPLAGGTIDGTLTVTGNTSVGGTFRVLTTGGTYAKFLVYPTNPYGIVFKSASNGTMTIQSQRESNDNETYPLVLNPSGGNVGVGTSSPSYKLDVNGTTRVSGISTLAGGIVLGTSTNAVAAKMEWDETNNAWKLNGNFYATGFVSAGGVSTNGGSGSGSDVNVIRAWSEYNASDTAQVVGSNLVYSLKDYVDYDLAQTLYTIDNRVTALEQGGGGGGGGTTTDPTLRMYPTTTNAWYSVLARYNNTSGSTYYTEYGRYTDNVQINPSTGALLATSLAANDSISTQGTLGVGLDASIGGNLTVTGSIINVGDSTFQGVTSFEDSITIDGVITLLNGQSSAEYQYPRYKLCASEAAYNAITTKQSDVLYLIPE